MYSIFGVPKTFITSISCSKVLSPGNKGYNVKNYTKMQPADQTSTSVPYMLY